MDKLGKRLLAVVLAVMMLLGGVGAVGASADELEDFFILMLFGLRFQFLDVNISFVSSIPDPDFLPGKIKANLVTEADTLRNSINDYINGMNEQQFVALAKDGTLDAYIETQLLALDALTQAYIGESWEWFQNANETYLNTAWAGMLAPGVNFFQAYFATEIQEDTNNYTTPITAYGNALMQASALISGWSDTVFAHKETNGYKGFLLAYNAGEFDLDAQIVQLLSAYVSGKSRRHLQLQSPMWYNTTNRIRKRMKK